MYRFFPIREYFHVLILQASRYSAGEEEKVSLRDNSLTNEVRLCDYLGRPYLADEQDQFYRNLSAHEEKHDLFQCIDQQSL